MKAEEQVKEMYPKAFIQDMGPASIPRPRYRVVIKPGRYCYGRMKSWAWKNALESILQDDELWQGRARRVVGKGGK